MMREVPSWQGTSSAISAAPRLQGYAREDVASVLASAADEQAELQRAIDEVRGEAALVPPEPLDVVPRADADQALQAAEAKLGRASAPSWPTREPCCSRPSSPRPTRPVDPAPCDADAVSGAVSGGRRRPERAHLDGGRRCRRPVGPVFTPAEAPTVAVSPGRGAGGAPPDRPAPGAPARRLPRAVLAA